MIYFVSDTHFNHYNILRYCNRPFNNVWEHNKHLIESWNKAIGPEDIVYHLGDFAFGSAGYHHSLLDNLNGTIHLILGNHDKTIIKKAHVRERFATVQNFLEIKILDDEMDIEQTIVLCHYPLQTWNKKHFGSWHLHGHCHGTIPSPDNMARLDVGVDNCNYRPMSYEDVKLCMTRKVFKPIVAASIIEGEIVESHTGE